MGYLRKMYCLLPLLLSVTCVSAMNFDIDAFRTWETIRSPRMLARAVSSNQTDNESVRPTARAAIANCSARTPTTFSILWAGKEAFKHVDDTISYWCEQQIQSLKHEEQSNYFMGYMLLRSQTTDDDCMSLTSGYDIDIDIVMAGISLLQNERNGRRREAIEALRNITPAMNRLGRTFRIQE